ncbi:MAG: leucine-rich repeat protein [Bacteroidales bacterium]|nr:leucine-rich repeat protein [Bacteroidales bacterium]
MNKLVKTLLWVAAGAVMFFSCNEYDDTDIWDKVNSLDKRVTSLESLVEKMNGNITSLQTIVTKLQTTVSITNVKETSSGYTITFTDGSSINLFHGEKGEKGDKGNNGTNGTNGSNGKDGADGKDAPVIGIALYQGVYYWTLTLNGNTSWLTDNNGNKIPVTGPKGDKGDTGAGEKGDPGENAPAPILKVDSDGYWLISYDSGASFEYVLDSNNEKVSALGYQGEKGDKGDKGEQGDSFFKSLVEGDDFVYLTLANDTVITIPKYRGFAIAFSIEDAAEVVGGESIDVTYTLSYGTSKSRVVVFPAEGWESTVTRTSNASGKITLTAPSVDCDGETVVLATDGNGQSTTAAFICKATSTGNLLFVADKLYNVSSHGANLQIDVQTTVDYTVEIPVEDRDWLSLEEIVTKATLRQDVVKLVVGDNSTPFDRTSTIEIVNKAGITLETIVINQVKGVTDNMLVYTSTDGNIVSPYNSKAFGSGVSILSNTISNGKGVISFSGKVTKIGDNAFSNCATLRTIDIPEEVTEIGINAFTGCTSLTEVSFNEKLNKIGGYAFNKCTVLADLYLPDSLAVIDEYAFAGTKIRTVTIGSKVKELVTSLFESQTALTSVILSEGLTTIGDNVFKGCTSLTSLAIPSSVSSIGYSVIEGCTNLNSLTIGGSLTYIPESLCKSLTKLKSVMLREGIEEIRSSAFDGCTALTSISIPNTVTTVGAYAFRNCSAATSITLGNNLRTIKEYAFYGCKTLKAITLPTRLETIGDFAFQGCAGFTELTIPASVTSVGVKAFYGDTGLVTVVIENGDVGESSFAGCSALINLTINKGTIGTRAFSSITTLSNVVLKGEELGKGVSSIGDYAFESCKALTKIAIPNSVTSIGKYAFSNCSSLVTLSIGDNVEVIKDYAFFKCNLENFSFNNKLQRIEQYAFNNNYNITSFTIPASITYLGQYSLASRSYENNFFLKIFMHKSTMPGWYRPICGTVNVYLYVPTGTKSNFSSSVFTDNTCSIYERDY